MKRRLQILIGVGAVLIVSGFIYWDNQTHHRLAAIFSLEPTYEGKTFTYWMHHWYLNPWGSPVNAEAVAALQSMGPKATPYLVKWIGKPPTYGLDFNYPGFALKGFEVLGPVAKPAIPGLIKIIGLNQDYPERALLCVGKDAVPALADKLVDMLSDRKNPFYFDGMRMNVRKDSGFFVRGRILSVLDRMGTNAEAALPALVVTASTNLPIFREGGFYQHYQQNPYKTLALVGKNHPDIFEPVLLKKFAVSPIERGIIAQAMCVFGTNQADVFLPVLIAAVSDNKTNSMVRIPIGEALTIIGASQPDQLVPVFLAAMTDMTSSEQVRSFMAGCLATVGSNVPKIALPALMTAYTNSSLYGRSSIAGALATFGNLARPMAPLMLADCQRPSEHPWDNHWKINLTMAIKRIAPEMPDTLSPLLNDLDDGQLGIRQQTIFAFGSLGTNGQEAVPALLKCLSHPDCQTRIDATGALNKIGVTSDEFIVDLGNNLSCTNTFMVQEAEETLGRLAFHSRLAFVTLVKKGVCGQIGRDYQHEAGWLLANITRINSQYLLECLDNSDVQLRSGALEVLLELRGSKLPDAIPKLISLSTNDPEPNIRSRAADALEWHLE
jgi:HEAT repeat protein